MSYRIASHYNIAQQSGPQPIRYGKTKVNVTNVFDTTEIAVGNSLYVDPVCITIGSIKVCRMASKSNIVILFDDYQIELTIDLYQVLENSSLYKCGQGIIDKDFPNTLLPNKDYIINYKLCGLKDPSNSYDGIRLVRVEDLLPYESPTVLSIRYYYNSAYLEVSVLNRGVVPVITNGTEYTDVDFNWSSLIPYSLSFIDCLVGDTITIKVKTNPNLKTYLRAFGYYIDQYGYLTAFDTLMYGKNEVSFQVTAAMYSISSELYLLIYQEYHMYQVKSVWVNTLDTLANGTVPTYHIYTADGETENFKESYMYTNLTQSSTPQSYFTGEQVLIKYAVDTASEEFIQDIKVEVIGNDGTVINCSVENEYWLFIMPQQECTIIITTINYTDNSTVFSTALNVFDFVSWEHTENIIDTITCVGHLDEDITFPIVANSYYLGLNLEYNFLINVPASKWPSPQDTLHVSLLIKLNDAYKNSIGSMLTIPHPLGDFYISPVRYADSEFKFFTDVVMSSKSYLLKKSQTNEYDFILHLILGNDKLYGIAYLFNGEPFIIKTTAINLEVLELTLLITQKKHSVNWGWTVDSGHSFNAILYGAIVDGRNLTTCYTCILPSSNVTNFPLYVLPRAVISDLYNHGLGETHRIEVVKNSELYFPSTITTLGEGEDGYVSELPYAGFYKVSAPGLVGTIPESSFIRNWNLLEFTVPDGVHTICEKAFAGAGDYYRTGESSKPFSIDLNKTTIIEPGAFNSACIKTLTIPSSITSMESPLYHPGSLISPCYIEDLTWDKKTETETLRNIFGKGIDDSLKTLTIGTNVESLPDRFLMIKGDVFLTIKYLGTIEQWRSKFSSDILQFWRGSRPITVQCSDGDLTI